jgi:hypothetical protein
LWLASLVLISAPLRVSLANGQQSLFALCCFAIAITVASAPFVSGFSLGLGFAKYSMAPVLVVVDLIRMRWVSLVCSAVPIVGGLYIAWRMTGTRLSELAVEPLRTAQIAVSPGYGDIMTALQLWLERAGVSSDKIFHWTGAAGLVCAVGVAVGIASARFTPRLELALVAIFTLFCFKHLIYDYVFLAFPLAALLECHQARRFAGTSGGRADFVNNIGWISIFYLLLFGTIQNRLHLGVSIGFVLSNGLALLAVAFALIAAQGANARVPAQSSASCP